jgi:alpha-glucosidase
VPPGRPGGPASDFDELLEVAHRLGIRVILDYVPNHTSDEHSWFVESRSSRENPKRDWFLWRDLARTLMQWDASPNAGFTTGTPWLPVADDYATTNVEAQRHDPASMLSLFRRLLRLRRKLPALTLGAYRPLETGNDQVISYLREDEDNRILVALNFGSEGLNLGFLLDGAGGEILCSTYPHRTGPLDPRRLELGPYEGVIVQLG